MECSIGDEVILSGDQLTAKQVGKFLIDHAESDQRTITLITVPDDPDFSSIAYGAASVATSVGGTSVATFLPEHYKIMLPAGKLGMTFKGPPCKVEAIAEDSPVTNIQVGHQVVQCSLGDEILLEGMNLTAKQVGKFLLDHSNSYMRTIALTVGDGSVAPPKVSTAAVDSCPKHTIRSAHHEGTCIFVSTFMTPSVQAPTCS